MAMSKRISRYPGAYLGYLESGYKTGLQITCKDGAAAQYLRLKLYGLREALKHEGDPRAWFADQVVMRIRDNILTITRVDGAGDGLVLGVQKIAEGSEAEIPLPLVQVPSALQAASEQEVSQAIERIKEKDPMESALEKLGYFAGAKKREEK